MRKKKIKITDIVQRIISPIPKGDKHFWGREVTLLKRLLEKYPDLKFWNGIELKKVPSFAIYLTVESKYLFCKYQEYLFTPEKSSQNFSLGEKSGEDYNPKRKPRNVKDFLTNE